MGVEFAANTVGLATSLTENYETLVLAEHDRGVGPRLEIQRALTFEAQGVARGWDTYCLVNEHGCTHYGGITSWKIERCQLVIRLASSACDAMGVSDGYSIQIPSPQRDVIRNALERLLHQGDPKG